MALASGLVGSVSAAAQGVVLDPTITTYAGTGSLTANNGGNGGPATAAGLNNPEGIAYDAFGNTFISDYGNNTIRVVNSAGIINAFAGTGVACAAPAANPACGDGGAASAATFTNPSALAFDAAGNLYVADYGDERVRKIAVDPATGVVDAASIVSTVAGTGVQGNANDANNSLATAAQLNNPHGIAIDSAGDIWISNQGENASCTVGYVPAAAQTITIGGVATNLTAGHYYTVAGVPGVCGGAIQGGGAAGVGSTTQLHGNTNIALDSANNLYIGDYQNGKVRKLVTTTGVISTVAGTAYQACPVNGATQGVAPAATPACGDGGAGTAATLNGPTGVYIDGAGDVIIGDAFGARVREIYGANSTAGTPGNITTISGTSQQCTNAQQTTAGSFTDGASTAGPPPTYGFENLNFPNCGDGGPATRALVSFPILISVNPQGNILYVDQYDNKIREINENIIFPATNVGVTSASQNLNLQTIGAGTTTISSITPSNAQFTVGNLAAGCALSTAEASGTICTAPVTFTPAYPGIQTATITVTTNGGTFTYGVVGVGVAPQGVLNPGTLSTVAGTGTAGLTNGTATASELNQPVSKVVFDSVGNYYFADFGSNTVRKVTPAGVISIYAGTGAAGYTGDGGQATAATLNAPAGVALDSAGNLYISDHGNNVIRVVSAATGVITTFIAGLNAPSGLAVNPLTQALYIADTGSNEVFEFSSALRSLTTVVGTGVACPTTTAACGDNGPGLNAQLNAPNGVAFDLNGNLFIADSGDNRIRKVVLSTGVISTVAGTGAAGYTGNGGAATAATLNNPYSLVLDAADDIYIAEQNNNVIRFVSGSTGKISTLVGNGTACTAAAVPFCGDGGPANVAALNAPKGVSLDNSGNIYVTDNGNNRIRQALVNPAKLTFPSTALGVSAGALTENLYNIGNAVLTYTTPAAGSTDALVTTTSNPTTGTANPVASKAFAQTNATTCGPITSTSPATTLPSGASCNYTVTFTPDTAVGAYTGTLVETDNSLYSGAANPLYPNPLTQTLNLAGTATAGVATVTLGSSLNPSDLGQSVTFTATLTGGGVPPTGTVSFSYTPIGSTTPVALGNGTISTAGGLTTATFTTPAGSTTALPVGTDTVTATYNGDGNYAGNTPSNQVAQVVNQVPNAGDTVTASPNPSAYGDPDTLTFCIPVGTGANAGAAVPSGTVQFSYGTPATNLNAPVTIGTTPTTVNGVSCYVATTTTTALPVGSDTVTAAFTAGTTSGYASASPTVAVTVAKAPVVNPIDPSLSQTFVASPTTQTFGMPVGLTYTIPVAAGNTPPTGPVTFTDGTLGLGACGNAANLPAFSAGSTFVFMGVTYTNYTCTLSTTALPSGMQTVTATYSTTDPNYSGGTATPAPPPLTAVVNITSATASATLTAGPNPTTFGTTVTITETLVPIGGVCPTAPVSFYSGGTVTGGVNTGGTLITTTNGTANPATVTPVPATGTPTSCVASIQTNSLPVGTTNVTATEPAGTPFSAVSSGPIPVTINQDAAADTLTTSPNPSTFGQSVTLTDTIPNAPNGTVATGTVQFYDYATPIGTPVTVGTGGVATLSTTTLPVGTDVITAVYSGNTNFAQVTSNAVNQIVNQVPTTATLSAAPNPTTFGTTVTIQEQIPIVNGVAPTGTVTFTTPNGTLTGTINSQGIASVTTNTLPVGGDPVTASYPGDSNYGPVNSGPVTVTVNKAVGPDTLAIAPNPSQFGSTTPVIATDTIPTVGGVAPTGTVTFYINGPTGTNLGTFPVVNGVATLSTTTLPVGTLPITAVYNGDGNYGVVTSNTVNEVIAPGNTVPALTANPNPTTFGTTVTLTEQIPGLNGVAPTGTVNFTYTPPGSTTPIVIASNVPVTNGVATTTISTLPIGVDAATAVYSGDKNYATATNSTNVTVGLAAGTDTIVGAPNPANAGTAVTFTYTVPVANGVTPTGTVTFFNGTTQITGTTTPFNAAGQTTITTSSLPVGTDSITGKYPGDNTYAAGTAATTETINQITGGDTVTASPSPTTYGTPVVLTFCIPVVGGTGVPTGTVTFSVGGTTINTPVAIGTTPTNGCYVATTTTSNLPVGSPTVVTGTYAPGPTSPYGPATPSTNINIGQAPLSNDSIKATPNPQTVAQPVTLSFSIPVAVGNAAPTGSVTFTSGGVTQGTAAVTFTAGATANGITTYTATTTTTTLPAGTDTVTGTYTGDKNYGGGPLSTPETINPIAGTDTVTVSPNPTVFGNPVTIIFCIPAVTGSGAPTGTVTFSVGGTTINTPVTIGTTVVNGCYVATTTTSGLPVGSPTTVTGTYNPGPTSPYGPGAPTGTVTVGPVTPTSIISYGPSSPTCSVTTVTLTDTITPVNGVTPTGTVQFYGTVNGVVTALGTPQTVVPPGVATLMIALPCGTTGIYAVYTGNSPYSPSTTPTVPLNLADFTIAATPPTQTVNPGDTVVYTVNLAGAGGAAFNSPVTLTATGLPPGATVKFGTATYVPGVGPTPTTMTIVTSPSYAMAKPTHGGNGVFYGLLLLPLLGIRRIRRKIRALPKGITYCLAALLLLGGLGAMTGCSGGYFGGGPNTFTITVTGTSGTLSHSTTVTLTVE